MDLDGPNGANDADADAIGDLLLIEVAQRVKNRIRADDTVSLSGDQRRADANRRAQRFSDPSGRYRRNDRAAVYRKRI